MARHTLWLTDAYYAGTTPYVQSLRAAALDGVDVRLLVPGATDLPISLLECGAKLKRNSARLDSIVGIIR